LWASLESLDDIGSGLNDPDSLTTAILLGNLLVPTGLSAPLPITTPTRARRSRSAHFYSAARAGAAAADPSVAAPAARLNASPRAKRACIAARFLTRSPT
jgi:hypothetical protein